jgi:hypothetical protein
MRYTTAMRVLSTKLNFNTAIIKNPFFLNNIFKNIHDLLNIYLVKSMHIIKGNGFEMKRLSENKLLDWKNSSRRKPLILRGTRQNGKTWIIIKGFDELYICTGNVA